MLQLLDEREFKKNNIIYKRKKITFFLTITRRKPQNSTNEKLNNE